MAKRRTRRGGLFGAGGAERVTQSLSVRQNPCLNGWTNVDRSARHLRLLTETIAAVNSTLDLHEVFDLIARKVAEALETDACFVYLYDEAANELVLRASHGTRVEDMTGCRRCAPGEGSRAPRPRSARR